MSEAVLRSHEPKTAGFLEVVTRQTRLAADVLRSTALLLPRLPRNAFIRSLISESVVNFPNI